MWKKQNRHYLDRNPVFRPFLIFLCYNSLVFHQRNLINTFQNESKTQLITKIYFGHFWTTQIKMFLKLAGVLSQSLLRLLIFIPWFCKTPQNTCWKHTGLSLALPRPAGPGVNLEQTKDKPVCFLQVFWGVLQNQGIKINNLRMGWLKTPTLETS